MISAPETWTAKSFSSKSQEDEIGKSIMVWNVKWFPGGNPDATSSQKKSQIQGVRKVLKEEQPFLLFLCEVRSLKTLMKLEPERLKYKKIACTYIPRVADEGVGLPLQSLAFLSQVPWEASWVIDFSQFALTRDRPRRGIIAIQFNLGERGKLFVYGVHLKSNMGLASNNRLKRERAMRYLEWDWKRVGVDWVHDEIIVLGDFNHSLLNPVYESEVSIRRLLDKGFSDVMNGAPWQDRLTIHSTYGFASDVFDYILVTSKIRRYAKAARVMELERHQISDHSPLLLETDGLVEQLLTSND